MKKELIKFPIDLDAILTEADRQGWVYRGGLWLRDGFAERTTEQLYNYMKKYKNASKPK